MAIRRINGTTHVRRRISIKARIATIIAVVVSLLLGGFFFLNKTDVGNDFKEKIANTSREIGQFTIGKSMASTKGDTGIMYTLSKDTSHKYKVTVKTLTLNDETIGGNVILNEKDNESTEMILSAQPKNGYKFMGWTITTTESEPPISNKSTIKVSVNSGYDYQLIGDTVFYAVFAENTDFSEVGEKSSNDDYRFDFDFKTIPEVGATNIEVVGKTKDDADYSYSIRREMGENWWWAYEDECYTLSSVKFSIKYPYSEAVTIWPVDSTTHTDSDHNDMYPHNKRVKASFRVYVKKSGPDIDTSWYQVEVSRGAFLGDQYDSQNDAWFYFSTTDTDIFGSDVTDPKVYYEIDIVPITQQGTLYQVHAFTSDSIKGRASGDASASVPFSTTIKAFAYEGYKFSHWNYTQLGSKNSSNIFDLDNYMVNCNTRGVNNYEAYFKPATYKVYASNLPSDGGDISIKGYVLDNNSVTTPGEEKEGAPGELEYAYTYNTDNTSSDFKKATAKPKVHVTITPKPGFHIENWSYTLKDTGTVTGDSEEFDIVDFEQDINLQVKYSNGKARIEVDSSPVTGGTATVRNTTLYPDTTQSKYDKTDYEDFIPGEQNALLVATPIDDSYVFLYWKDSNGKKYDGVTDAGTKKNSLTINNVASSEKFTAYFAKKTINITTKVTPSDDAGSVTVTGDDVLGSSPTYTATPNTAITVKATEKSGYHFQKFVDMDGKEYTSNPLVKTDLITDETFTAVFIYDEFDITAIASPITGGSVDIKVGDNTKAGSNKARYGDTVTLIAKPSKDDSDNALYDFMYFEDQNGKQYKGVKDGDNYKFEFNAVNGAETYKAYFVKKQVSLGVNVSPDDTDGDKYKAGKVDVTYTNIVPAGDKNKTYDKPGISDISDIQSQTNVTLKATEFSGYHFSKYVDDRGSAYTDNPLTIANITDDTHITAIFVPDEFEIKAISSPSTGGTVKLGKDSSNVREGSAKFTYGDNVYIIAEPKSDYIFRYFEDQNGNKYDGEDGPGTDEVHRVFKAVNGPETYKAVFGMNKVNVDVKVDPSTDIKSGPDFGKYVAGCAEVTYIPFGSTTNQTDTIDKDGSSTIADIAGGTSVKIKAIEKTGYHFVKFIDDEGNTWNENPLVFGDLVENKNIEIIYVPDEFEIKAVATPAVGGKATVNGREGSNTVKHGQEVVIEAIPASSDFEFRYFEDQNGTKYEGNPVKNILTFNAVNGAETFKAVFAMSEVTVSVKVDPSDTDSSGQYLHGGFRVDYTSTDPTDPGTTGPLYEPKTVEHIKGQTSVKITALEGDGYRFSKFVDTDGNTFTENPLVYPDLVESKDVEVIFVPETFTISAQATPVTGGTVKVKTESDPAGREGSNKVAYDERVTLVASPTRPASPDDVGYEFRYFEDPNGSKYGGSKNSDGDYELSFNAVNGSETYKAVFAMSKVAVSVKVDPPKTIFGSYTAGGYRIEYTDLAGEPQSSGEKYKADTYRSIKGQTSVKITAIEGDGYHFAKFVDTDGGVYNDNPLIYPDLVEDKDVEIIFVPDEFTISAQATPVIGGKVDVTVGGSTREGSNKVAYDDEVTITAKPNPGFSFRYFEDQNGSKYGGTMADDGTASFKFKAVNGSETYKAVFAMSTVHLSVKVDPNTLDGNGKYIAGKFKVNYTYTDITDNKEKNIDKEGDAPNFKIENIKGQSSVKITAIELGGYKFSKFIDSEGNMWTENPMVLGDLIENKDIEIIYVKDHWRIEGQASPEAGGKVTLNGVESGLDVDYGDSVTIEAKPNEGYKFKFFKDELGNEFLANPITFNAINGSEKYTAYFSKDEVNITIDLAPEGAGSVRFNSETPVTTRTTYPTGGKSSVTLTAAPKDGNKFLYWRDQDGNSYTDNPLVITDIGRDLIFTAIFDSEYETIRAIASPASGGKVTKIVNADGSITLVATASRGYKFANWTKPNGMTLANKFKIPASTVRLGDVYTAHFKIDPNYDAKSDITKEKFYREWRKVETPSYTVTRDYIKMLASQAIADGHYGYSTPGLRSYNAIENARGYFNKGAAEDDSRLTVKFGDSELITAEGEKLTPDALPDLEKYFSDAEKFTDKKFGDRYETELLTVKRILQPGEFNNKKRTYLWRYTGAEYKDNIYLLYDIGDDKTDYVTPIVDEDGVLKFTIDELRHDDVVAVVRVKIK